MWKITDGTKHERTSEFNSKVVVVTGGAGGIGLETVKLLVEAGATVYVADLNPWPLMLYYN
jgi:NAD(P)-dependent dehydrogenase (short-subunit alcohol dehydrogenase family)